MLALLLLFVLILSLEVTLAVIECIEYFNCFHK